MSAELPPPPLDRMPPAALWALVEELATGTYTPTDISTAAADWLSTAATAILDRWQAAADTETADRRLAELGYTWPEEPF